MRMSSKDMAITSYCLMKIKQCNADIERYQGIIQQIQDNYNRVNTMHKDDEEIYDGVGLGNTDWLDKSFINVPIDPIDKLTEEEKQELEVVNTAYSDLLKGKETE